MATKNIEIQDSDGNIYYPHTDASVVKNGSTTVAEQLKDIANDSYPIVEATGTNAYIGSSARINKLSKGTRCTLFIGNNSNGNCSLNLNNYGAKNIKDSFGNVVTNLKTNIPYNLCYNGTDFILQGKGGGGNATADKVLEKYTFTNDSGSQAGTMVNQGTKTASLNCGGNYIIPAGYHNGSGKVTANSLASQTPGNATADKILDGYVAWVNGNKIIGTKSDITKFIPGTKTLLCDNTKHNSVQSGKTGITAESVIVKGHGEITVTTGVSQINPNWQHGACGVGIQVYINNTPKGKLHWAPSTDEALYTENFTVNEGDKIQVYATVENSGYSIYSGVRTFKITCGNDFGLPVVEQNGRL